MKLQSKDEFGEMGHAAFKMVSLQDTVKRKTLQTRLTTQNGGIGSGDTPLACGGSGTRGATNVVS
jgi:hypothetical protein